ncbi:MAG: ABC transporter ATP-binding protein [Candidatus Omnitrophica bacterium]|nr:ABC transporter ATP-binding protein [Candidatus Omnitrophota bacterium]
MISNKTGLFQELPFLKGSVISFASLNQSDAILLIFIFIFLMLVMKNVFLYLSNILIAKLRFSTIRDLRINLMGNLIEYDIQFFHGVKTGNIIGVINAETERMGDFILAVLTFVAVLARILAYVIILFLISWRASIIVFLLTAAVLMPIELIMKNIKRIGRSISESIKEYNHKLMEILGGMALIKSCSTEDLEKGRFNNATRKLYLLHYQTNKNIHLIIPLSEALIFGLIFLCFLALINVIKIDMARSFPFIATYLLVLARMLTQLNSLNTYRSTAISRLAAFENYEDMYDREGKRTIISGQKKIDKVRDSIEFRDVYFSYDNADRYVLNKLNIKIPMGKMTAFVGVSGAGKSTIINLIVRFYDVELGQILVDGVNLKALDLRVWRRKIGFVSQDTFIFNASVKDNIAYGHDGIPDTEIFRAARAANAHEFITGLPSGYDTVLGERGVRLSGGQKQRISIARAIIHNPEVLILDEATSSLDTETERLIKEAIDELARERTVIAIAHRLSTIVHADNIIVLEEGKVAESGRHAELLERNGLYRRLYDIQFRI